MSTRREQIAFALLMGVVTTGIISFGLVASSVGFDARLPFVWMRSWGLAYVLVVPLIQGSNISSAFFACGALAALGALCFHRAAGGRLAWSTLVAGGVLLGLSFGTRATEEALRVWCPKGRPLPRQGKT